MVRLLEGVIMRTVEEIRDYLMLNNRTDEVNKELIRDALFVEENYSKDIENNNFEYALLCDFENSPFVLEDEDEVEYLEKIEQVGGIVVYKPIYID